MMNLIKVSLLEPAPLIQVNSEEQKRRWYEDKEGNKYPSITTILAHAFPWTGPVLPYDYALRGSYVHEMAEHYILNKELKQSEFEYKPKENRDAKIMFSPLKTQLNRLNEVKILETTLHSKKIRTAGTCDAAGTLNDEDGFWVIDFKTSNHPKDESQIQSYFIQASFYSIAIKELYGIDIAGIKIWITCKNGIPFQEFSKTSEQLKPYKKVLKDIRINYHKAYGI